VINSIDFVQLFVFLYQIQLLQQLDQPVQYSTEEQFPNNMMDNVDEHVAVVVIYVNRLNSYYLHMNCYLNELVVYVVCVLHYYLNFYYLMLLLRLNRQL